MDYRLQYQAFLAALREYIDDGGHGTKTYLANNCGLSPSFITQVLKPNAKKQVKPENQKVIAEFISGSFDKFISKGHALLNQKSFQNPHPDEELSEAEKKLLLLFGKFKNKDLIIEVLGKLLDVEHRGSLDLAVICAKINQEFEQEIPAPTKAANDNV